MARPAPMDLVIFINMCFPNDVTMMPRSKPHASGLFHDIMGKHKVTLTIFGQIIPRMSNPILSNTFAINHKMSNTLINYGLTNIPHYYSLLMSISQLNALLHTCLVRHTSLSVICIYIDGYIDKIHVRN